MIDAPDLTRSDAGNVVLQDSDAAVVWSAADGRFVLVLPKLDLVAAVPEPVVMLSAVMMRMEREPAFRAELIAWMERYDSGGRAGGLLISPRL